MSEVDDFERKMNRLPASDGPVESTGFGENFTSSLGLFLDEETTISSYLNSGAYNDRDRELDKRIKAGEIDTAGYYDGGDIDYSRLAYDLKRQGYDVLDDYDVRENIRSELSNRRKYANDVRSRARASGVAGQFVGTLVGSQMDPINAAALLIPGLAAIRTGTALARAGKAALWYGGTNAGVEAIIQGTGQVQNWKEHLGLDHTVADSLESIAWAGVGGAVLGTGAEFGADYIRRGFKRTKERIKEFAPEEEKSILLKEIEHAEQQYNWHVQLYEREKVMRRIERLKALRQQLNDTIKAREKGEEVPLTDEEQYLLDEFNAWLEESDFPIIDTVDDIDDIIEGQTALFGDMPSANDEVMLNVVPNNDPRFDADTNAIISRMEAVDQLEADEWIDPPDSAIPDDVPEGREVGDPFRDFDEDAWFKMTPEQREAYLVENLGDDFDLERAEVPVEVGLDGDGNVMYSSKSRAEVEEEVDEMLEQLDNFLDCWTNPDA